METKQIIAFRKDLLEGDNAISTNNFVAYCCRASVDAMLSLFCRYECTYPMDQKFTRYEIEFGDDCISKDWFDGERKEEVVLVDNTQQLMDLVSLCLRDYIPTALITSEESDHLGPVCVGVGPWASEELDKLMEELKK